MPTVRQDLADTHAQVWDQLADPGAWWTGPQRVELARTVLFALDDDDVLPPWVSVTGSDRPVDAVAAPPVAHDLAYRMTRHAGTLTPAIAAAAIDELDPLPYVELCGLVSSIAAIAHFDRSAGLERRRLPEPREGEPSGEQPAELEDAEWNWVPVAAPADRTPAVVQAYTGVPPADGTTWQLAAVQYIPNGEMGDPAWRRRSDGLSRPEMELVASRVAQLRECFY